MAIISAAIDATGWVLEIVRTGAAGTFSDYTLDPDGEPRLVVRSSHPGFTVVNNEAVAATQARAIQATIPLRLPVDPNAPLVPVIDETDIGGGQIRVRIALSNYVYATDTSVTLDALPGWFSGEPGASGISVTNNSTETCPVPIFRWASLPMQVETGVFRLSLLVASHHPNGFQPLAGVKFTVTDGTNTKTLWATALATDNDYGDGLRCYTVLIDPATAPALTEGRLRCDAECYPWIGAMRSTDPAGTRVMSGIGTLTRSTDAQVPRFILYDPAGTRYLARWLYVDPAGTTSASSAMVATSLAAAKDIPPGSRPANVSTALQALYLANRTLPAANGGDSVTRSADAARIVLSPGVNTVGSVSVTNGLNTSEAPVVLLGDPDDPDPRNNCILRSGAAAPPTLRAFLWQIENCRLEIGESTLLTGAGYFIFKRATVRGKPGFETSTSGLTTTTLAANRHSLTGADIIWTHAGIPMNTPALRAGLLRKWVASRTVRGFALLTGLWAQADDDTVGPGTAVGNFALNSDLPGCEDNFIAYNDLRRLRAAPVYAFSYVPAATAGTTYQSYRRNVIMGNLAELFGVENSSPNQVFGQIGESISIEAVENIFDSNTFMGGRWNVGYNDPPSGSPSVNSIWRKNRRANNAFDRNATKHDDFFDGTYGYRPWLTGGWSFQNGVMHEGNWDGGRAAGNIGSFRFRYPGLRSVQTAVQTAPGFTDDQSTFAGNLGGGTYQPVAGSPLLRRVLTAQSDRDFLGKVILIDGAAGALEFDALPIEPNPAQIVTRASSPAVTGAATTSPDAAQIVTRASSPLVTGDGVTPISPQDAQIVTRASAPALTIGIGLVPSVALILTRAGEAAVGVIVEDDDLMPISLAEAKVHLREDLGDQDDYIRGLVRSAAAMVEDYCGMVVGPARQLLLTWPTFGERLIITRRPLISVDLLEYDAIDGTETSLDPETWRVREFLGRPTLVPAPGFDWPPLWPRYGTVRLTLTAGFASRDQVPANLKQAVLELVALWFANREAANVGNIVQEMPFGVKALLGPYKRGLLG
jgi:uncharacterized phiE125 gp8 family phage protein